MRIDLTPPDEFSQAGSCYYLVSWLQYLNEGFENLEDNADAANQFITKTNQRIGRLEVIVQIDRNATGQGLTRQDAKFYTFQLIADDSDGWPNDAHGLFQLASKTIQYYAASFKQPIDAGQLMWFAIENKQAEIPTLTFIISRCLSRDYSQEPEPAGRTARLDNAPAPGPRPGFDATAFSQRVAGTYTTPDGQLNPYEGPLTYVAKRKKYLLTNQ